MMTGGWSCHCMCVCVCRSRPLGENKRLCFHILSPSSSLLLRAAYVMLIVSAPCSKCSVAHCLDMAWSMCSFIDIFKTRTHDLAICGACLPFDYPSPAYFGINCCIPRCHACSYTTNPDEQLAKEIIISFYYIHIIFILNGVNR